MSWSILQSVPNPHIDLNGDPYSGAVLKAYLSGTTTSTSIAIDSSGTSPQASITFNAEGKLEVSGNEIQPFIDRECKWAIFANSTDAAANTPAQMGFFDNVPQTPSKDDSINRTSNFNTLNDAVVSTDIDKIFDGGVIELKERTTGNGGGGMWDVVLSSTVTENTYNIVQCTGVVTLSLVLRVGDTVNVKQWGAVGDGVADDTLSLQAAIDNLGDVLIPLGVYKTTAELTFPGEVTLRGVTRRGGDGTSTIHAVHTGDAILNLAGFTHQNVSNLELTTDVSTFPKCGMILGRTSAASSGHHNFNFLKIQGYFSVAAIYSIASEVNTWSDIYVWNLGTSGAKYCFYTSSADDLGVGGLTASTNLVSTFTSAYFINNSTDPDAACIYMESDESMGSWNWFNPYLIPTAGSYIHINNVTDAQALGPYGFYGLGGERVAGGDPMYGLRVTSDVGFKLNGLNVVGNRFDLNANTTTTGADDTSTAAAFMTNSGAGFTIDALIDKVITNETDGSFAVITDNTATTVTAVLRGGTNNTWDSGDTYSIDDQFSVFIDPVITLTQPNVVLQQPESFPYALDKYERNNMQGGIFSVGRIANWEDASLNSGWVNNFGGGADAGYSMDGMGNVAVRGIVGGGTGVIFTLPSAYRPKNDEWFGCTANGATGRLKIDAASGDVTLDVGSPPQVTLASIKYTKGN